MGWGGRYRVVANSTVETLFINKLKLTEHCSLELFERLKTANALRSSWRNARILLWLKMIRKGTWVPEKERACIEPEISKAQTKQHIGLAECGVFFVDISGMLTQGCGAIGR